MRTHTFCPMYYAVRTVLAFFLYNYVIMYVWEKDVRMVFVCKRINRLYIRPRVFQNYFYQ